MSLDRDDWQHLLHEVEINTTDKRRDAATRLLKLVSYSLMCGDEIPQGVRDWLAAVIVAGVSDTSSADRLVLTLRKGNPGSIDRETYCYAHVFALMQWGRTQDEAAEIVRSTIDAPEAQDASATKKRSNRGREKWTAEGPYLHADDRVDPSLPVASEDHLRTGKRVIVELFGPGRRRTKCVFLDRRIVR